jgi:exopolyphosphatase/guanosine-5'-triphosphate,3'-diphosphate pyrophosphatase
MDPEPPDICATIHIGASSVSMLVVHAGADESDPPLEFLEQPLPLARDIFREGAVSRSTTERAVQIILGYLGTLRELGAGPGDIARAVTTNILAEATNSEVFLTRLGIACGICAEILDDGEMTRLIYLKTRRRLRDTPSMQKRVTLVVHVGPGNTRALLFKRGRIVRYTSYRLGTYRTAEALETANVEGPALLRVLREHIRGQINQMRYDYRDEEVEDLVVIGYEIQLLTPFLTRGSETRSSLKALRSLAAEAADFTDEERVRRYQLDYHTAEGILPAVEINLSVAKAFGLRTVRIPGSDYERGLLHDLPLSTSMTASFQTEVVRSARILARKYQADDKHGAHVARLSKRLFDETEELHQLGGHDALLLEVAAILHETGGYISPKAHHKHSQYIISNSEIFGLGRLDIQVIALVARYHRHSGPHTNHAAYRALPAGDRIRVTKLASLLRVADALERTHSQRVRDIEVKRGKERIHLVLRGVSDAAAERLAMQSKGDVFEDTFGLKIILNEQR